jgi:hypothetical protein
MMHNTGRGGFEDVTRGAGLEAVAGLPQGAIFLDFDNDSDQDLHISAYGRGQLFQNEGGYFVDATSATGLDLAERCGGAPCYSIAASAGDYDRHGHLDLLVINHVGIDQVSAARRSMTRLYPVLYQPQRLLLFHNTGRATFADATDSSGLGPKAARRASAIWTDVNSDQWPDLFVANYLGSNELYLNQADCSFVEQAHAAGLAGYGSSRGVAAGDFDNDGDFDLATTNLIGAGVSLYVNHGSARFRQLAGKAGLSSSKVATGWGIEFVDVDLDGHLDLAVSAGPVSSSAIKDTENRLYRNRGDGTFVDVSEARGDMFDNLVSRGLASLDLEGDGDSDLVVAGADGAAPMLLRTDLARPSRWLQVRLEGVQSNRDAVGARVELTRTDGLRAVQEVRAGASYQGSSSKTLCFGLGDAGLRELDITWPSGRRSVIDSVPVNTRLEIRESERPES